MINDRNAGTLGRISYEWEIYSTNLQYETCSINGVYVVRKKCVTLKWLPIVSI
jgi:hypothetical protein